MEYFWLLKITVFSFVIIIACLAIIAILSVLDVLGKVFGGIK